MLSWRRFIVSLAWGVSALAIAQEPVGLLAWTKTHPDWKSDKKELAHVASQCATMYDLLGNFFAANPIHEEQRRSANIFLSNSDIYATNKCKPICRHTKISWCHRSVTMLKCAW